MDYKNGIRSHLAWGDGEADIKEILDIFDRNRFSGHFVLNIQIVNTFGAF